MRASDDNKSPEELSVKMQSEEESLDDIDDSQDSFRYNMRMELIRRLSKDQPRPQIMPKPSSAFMKLITPTFEESAGFPSYGRGNESSHGNSQHPYLLREAFSKSSMDMEMRRVPPHIDSEAKNTYPEGGLSPP